jgi:hypothetical protein
LPASPNLTTHDLTVPDPACHVVRLAGHRAHKINHSAC